MGVRLRALTLGMLSAATAAAVQVPAMDSARVSSATGVSS
jgi:hypothetical protein